MEVSRSVGGKCSYRTLFPIDSLIIAFQNWIFYTLPQKKFFSNFYLPYKKQLLFLSFHWVSVVPKGPAPLCYKSKYVVGPSSPTHTARQDFVGPNSSTLSQIIRAQLISPKNFFLTFICHIKSNYCFLAFIAYLLYQRAQLPHTVSDYQGPAPPHCLRLSGPSSPDNKSQKFFPKSNVTLNDFQRYYVALEIVPVWHVIAKTGRGQQFSQHRCKFLNSNQKHATCCLSSGYAENRSQWHVTLHFFLWQHRIVANRPRKSFSVILAWLLSAI